MVTNEKVIKGFLNKEGTSDANTYHALLRYGWEANPEECLYEDPEWRKANPTAWFHPFLHENLPGVKIVVFNGGGICILAGGGNIGRKEVAAEEVSGTLELLNVLSQAIEVGGRDDNE